MGFPGRGSLLVLHLLICLGSLVGGALDGVMVVVVGGFGGRLGAFRWSVYIVDCW